MKYILLLLFLLGCSKFPLQRTGIVHDYIINKAKEVCKPYSGLHYIVDRTLILEKGKIGEYSPDYPCNVKIIAKCQDSRQFVEFYADGRYCAISQLQIKDAILKNGNEDNPKNTIRKAL